MHILQDLKIPKDSYLVSLDIESLYTNITNKEAITTLLRRFKSHPLKVFLLDLLKYVLKNNAFKFNDLIFTQVCGIAMGTKLASALATIYIRRWTRRKIPISTPQATKTLEAIHRRCIHDLATHTGGTQWIAKGLLNRTQEKIKFTAEISTYSRDFLNFTIYKSPTFLPRAYFPPKSCINPLTHSHTHCDPHICQLPYIRALPWGRWLDYSAILPRLTFNAITVGNSLCISNVGNTLPISSRDSELWDTSLVHKHLRNH